MGNVTAKTSGDIASFMTPAETNITSLKVHFSPKQLGEGDPSPENVREIVGWDGVEVNGRRKNLFDKSQSIDNYRLKTDGTNYSATGYYISPFIPVKTGQLYIKNSPSIDAYHRFCTYTTNDPKAFVRRIDNINYITIESNETYIRFCGEIIEKDTAQLELGSTATSYKPYQGTTIPIDFTNNYLNKVQITNNKTINSTGEEITESRMSVTDYIPVNENEKWVLSFISTTAGRTRRIWGYDENKQPISEFEKVSWATVDQEYILTATITSDVKYIRVCYYTNDTDLLLTIDGTSFKNVYGGYVDLISGELVEEYNFVNIDYSNPWSTTTNYLYRNDNLPSSIGGRNMYVKTLCSHRINPYDVTAAVVVNTQGNISVGRKFCEMAGIEMTSDAFNQYLMEQNNNGTPLEVCYLLKTPITHQLTPTQLSSFIGQNNFWSNADYVEIEYELKETEDIQKVRKKIILNQPHIESITGDAVSFTTDMKAPLKECKVYFEPIQEGEGDPSPDNVRNITGWDGVEVKNDNNVYSIDWTDDVGTVYGGYVDLVKGELVAEWIKFVFDRDSKVSKSGTSTIVEGLTWMTLRKTISSALPYMVTPNDGDSYGLFTIGDWQKAAVGRRNRAFVNSENLDVVLTSINGEDLTTSEGRNTFFDYIENNNIPIECIYKLAEPIHYQLTPQQLLTFKGINNFSCGIKNDLSIRYWNYKKSNSSNIAYEAKNLTFDGTNYIDTGVYLFSEKNINRDFEVVIEDLYGDGGNGNLTIVCAKYDSTAIGFLIRVNGSSNTTYNGTISMKRNNHNNITIKRINSVITIEGEIITNPEVKFTNAVHNHPLVLGCALQDDGMPMRYTAGTIEHITVKWL